MNEYIRQMALERRNIAAAVISTMYIFIRDKAQIVCTFLLGIIYTALFCELKFYHIFWVARDLRSSPIRARDLAG
jgi:hypothetical protein